MKRFLALILLASCASLNAQAADPATVNGKPIQQSLIDYIIKSANTQGKAIDGNARAAILEKLITTELIDQEAQKSGLDKQADFQLKEELARRELRINAYIEDFIRKNPVADSAVQSEYDRLKGQLSGKEYKASHILVKTEDEAKRIISQLDMGTAFAQLAKEKSIDTGTQKNGGDLGWFQPEGMVKPFSTAVSSLQKGRYSASPVQTEFGWHVILLEDVRDTQPPNYDAVKEEIRNDLQRRQLEAMVNGLRAKAKIEKAAAENDQK